MGCSLSREHQPASPLPGMGGAGLAAGPPRCKLVLLGDTGVGKSCIVQRQCRHTFNPDSAVTVGAAFLAHTLTTPGGRMVKFEIWDTAGQERYASLAPLYYRGANAAAIVYDVSSPASFQRAQFWVGELRRNTAGAASGTAGPVLVLVGNKTDLPAEERAVTREQGAALAESHGMLFIETSAKTGSNVSALFQLIADSIAEPHAATAAGTAGAVVRRTTSGGGGGGSQPQSPAAAATLGSPAAASPTAAQPAAAAAVG